MERRDDMISSAESPRYSSYNINKFNIELSNDLFDCRIFWARVVSSESESLFTEYTKHSFYEIQYALQGSIGMILGDNTPLAFDESDFVIIPPDTYHQIVESDPTGARFIMAFSLRVKDDSLADALSVLSEPRPYRESAHMRNLLSVILQKNYHDDALRKESITSLVECFFLEVMEQIAPHRGRKPHPSPSLPENLRKVTEIEAFLHEYNGIGLRVSDIALRFGISERHLSRLFSEVRGYSLRDAMNREKLKKIEELVISTELSLSEISQLCEFSDEYAMNKFFRRLNKINLSEFRRIATSKAI